MYKWGDGLDPYRRRIAHGEDRQDVIDDLETRRAGLVEAVRDDNRDKVVEAIRQTDDYIRELQNPRPPIQSDAW